MLASTANREAWLTTTALVATRVRTGSKAGAANGRTCVDLVCQGASFVNLTSVPDCEFNCFLGCVGSQKTALLAFILEFLLLALAVALHGPPLAFDAMSPFPRRHQEPRNWTS